MSGTEDPQPQIGSPGNQPLLNTNTNEETEDHDLFSSDIFSPWQLPHTNPPPLIGGLAEVGPHGGPTHDPPFSPAIDWNPNITTQNPTTDPYNTQPPTTDTYSSHQISPNSHQSVPTAPSPPSDNVPYLPQSPPRVPYGSGNLYTSLSFSISSYPTGHSQSGPPLSNDEFNAYLETVLLPMPPHTPQV
ncbi:hypothetical protein FRC00_010283, partial [Tulasnella sp. 408]